MGKKRKKIERLERRIEILEAFAERVGEAGLVDRWHVVPAKKPSGALTYQPTGTWVERDECLVCHEVKGPGRERRYTCAPCGEAYVADRYALRDTCLSCGAGKPATRAYTCRACREARDH